MGSQVVDRDFAMLHQLGAELYKPSSMSVISEMMANEVERLKRLLSYRYALPASDPRFLSTMVFNVEKLGSVSSLPSFDLARVGRDFLGAIENANKTELVTRGPLDLKSAEIIPPQIVLDQEVCVRGRVGGRLTEISFIRGFWLCLQAEGAVQHVTSIFLDLRTVHVLSVVARLTSFVLSGVEETPKWTLTMSAIP